MADKEWMIMVYLAGNNNLVEEMVFALREIYRIGARDDCEIIVQFDTGGPPRRFTIDANSDLLAEQGERLKRLSELVLKVPKENRIKIVRQFLAERLKEERAREDRELEPLGRELRIQQLRPTRVILRDFVGSCLEKSNAKNYMLILSGHGSGAVGDFLGGDTPTSRLGIRDLPYVLESFRRRGKRLNILGMDSCLMSMAEVAYEVHEYVDFMVGAEGFERNTGWPYARLLERLMAEPNLSDVSPVELAKKVVQDYIEYYENYTLADLSTDIAALDLQRLRENLVPTLKTLAQLMRGRLEEVKDMRFPNPIRDAILLAHWEAQSYKNEQYTDLWDFCNLLTRRCGTLDENGDITDGKALDRELARACVAVRDAIYRDADNGVVKLSGYCGAAFQHSHGLSVFFPWAEIKDAGGASDLDAYGQLQFATEKGGTDWHAFLTTYVRQTQRQPRGEGRKDAGLKRTSRLNERPGIYTSLALQARGAPPEDRGAPPEDRGAPPEDRFASAQMGDTKNQAVDWYPCDLITNAVPENKY